MLTAKTLEGELNRAGLGRIVLAGGTVQMPDAGDVAADGCRLAALRHSVDKL